MGCGDFHPMERPRLRPALVDQHHAVHLGAAPWIREYLGTLASRLLTESEPRLDLGEVAAAVPLDLSDSHILNEAPAGIKGVRSKGSVPFTDRGGLHGGKVGCFQGRGLASGVARAARAAPPQAVPGGTGRRAAAILHR